MVEEVRDDEIDVNKNNFLNVYGTVLYSIEGAYPLGIAMPRRHDDDYLVVTSFSVVYDLAKEYLK